MNTITPWGPATIQIQGTILRVPGTYLACLTGAYLGCVSDSPGTLPMEGAGAGAGGGGLPPAARGPPGNSFISCSACVVGPSNKMQQGKH
jgi:hypothetical protein